MRGGGNNWEYCRQLKHTITLPHRCRVEVQLGYPLDELYGWRKDVTPIPMEMIIVMIPIHAPVKAVTAKVKYYPYNKGGGR